MARVQFNEIRSASLCQNPQRFLSLHPCCRGRRRRRPSPSDGPSQTFYSHHTSSCYLSPSCSRNRMGNCCSHHNDQEKEAAHRSAQIDRQIEQDGKKLKKECKILLLGASALTLYFPAPYLGNIGSSESGKSTIVKQMRIIHQDGFSYDTKVAYREAIYSNLLESAQAVATAMLKFKVEPADPSNVVSSSRIQAASCRFPIPSHVGNVESSTGIRSRCGAAVANMFISLCLPERTRRSYTPSLARPSGARVC